MDIWPGTRDTAWDRAQADLEAAGVTDGLPVVPPTADRVAEMLAVNGLDPDEEIAALQPLYAPANWRDIAINAVMAGCRPQYLPVIGAAVEGIADDAFNLTGIATTTGSAAPLIIVNGPVARALGLNAEGNALGPGVRANATIGRALSLCLRNIGGAKPGELDMATLGQPGKYTFCLAENEAASPWAPLHVDRGFAADDSIVTVVGASGNIEVVCSSTRGADDVVQTLAESMQIAGTVGGGGFLGGGEPLILLPPELAALFVRDGYDKAQAKAALYGRVRMPVDRLPPEVRDSLLMRWKASDIGPTDGLLRIAASAEDVMFVVAGGVGVKACYVPTWSGTTKAVSRRVRGATKR
jgi:hypothetical protein